MWWAGPLGKAEPFMSDIKAARELMARAFVDLEALRELVDNPRVADEIFGFLAQQAAEKSLKAWLALQGKQYPITHNLDQLFQELKDAGVKTSGYGDLSALNPFAVQFRYESMDSSEPGIDRDEILRRVEALVKKVQAIVGHGTNNGPIVHEPHALYGAKARKAKPKVRSKKRKPRS